MGLFYKRVARTSALGEHICAATTTGPSCSEKNRKIYYAFNEPCKLDFRVVLFVLLVSVIAHFLDLQELVDYAL